ncbi:MAG: enoyl-CoA hydratase/isomerase family protein [Pseudomonadota bacterium]
MSTVSLQISDGIALLTLENPSKLNALTMAMLSTLESQLTELEHDPAVHAVIVTGSGEKAFCCGADIAAWGQLSAADFARYWVRHGHRVFDRLARLAKPTIAALNGHAFGGGLELAAACDLRLIAPHAKLALPEAGIGIVPGWSGTQRLMRLLPEPVVKEMALFGARIDAKRAVELGFAAQSGADAVALARELAGQVVELSPRAVEVAKYMIHAAAGEDSAAMVEALGSAAISASEDRAEGVAAFLGKRAPNFTGA